MSGKLKWVRTVSRKQKTYVVLPSIVTLFGRFGLHRESAGIKGAGCRRGSEVEKMIRGLRSRCPLFS